MNEKQAYRILQLSPPATRDQAKKAYRRLAKKYHPDRCVEPGMDSAVFESTMAHINLAFRFLAPGLEDEVKNKTGFEQPELKPNRKKKLKNRILAGWQAFLAGCKRLFGNVHERQNKFEDQAPPCSGPDPGPGPKKSPRFEEVLKTCSPGAFKAAQKEKRSSAKRKRTHTAVFKRYQAYVKLNKQVRQTASKRSYGSRIEPVEQIDPVSPIDRVSRK